MADFLIKVVFIAVTVYVTSVIFIYWFLPEIISALNSLQ